ncbi:MAG TPA: adenylate/guanylate cyclase domain-containing protein [Solirubrobacteraceae bacterium]|nr:adenylate/guanylate cyclase domain-containing protein [Solirubrobacteraceae bacterium]
MAEHRVRIAAWTALVTLPLAGLAILLASPEADVHWENHPAHFWLVLGTSVATAILAYVTGEVADRRGDARLFLVSLGFLAAAGFLGLHALATPKVLLDGPNGGFVLATPVGLVVAAALAALSAAPGEIVSRHVRVLRVGLFALMAIWAAASLAQIAPLNDPMPPESGSAPLTVLAVVGLALYGYAALRYAGLYRRRRAAIIVAIVTAFVLLAEAMVAVAFARNWHASWWEWHVLMLAAFALIALAARAQGPSERFSDLYLEATTASTREVSVIFADLAGFTAFSEGREPRAVSEMLNAYFEAAIPAVVRHHGGEIDRIIGDEIMVTFNTRGDQPDHPQRAAAAALDLQRETAALADAHPDWPRFRVGINTGDALVGVVGAREGRSYTVIGDTVNVASRLQAAAPVGGVAVGAATLRHLRGARVEALGALPLRGKSEPVDAYVLQALR